MGVWLLKESDNLQLSQEFSIGRAISQAYSQSFRPNSRPHLLYTLVWIP